MKTRPCTATTKAGKPCLSRADRSGTCPAHRARSPQEPRAIPGAPTPAPGALAAGTAAPLEDARRAVRLLHRHDVEILVSSRDRVLVQLPLAPLPGEARAAVDLVLGLPAPAVRALLEETP